jgi:hypothetical protein
MDVKWYVCHLPLDTTEDSIRDVFTEDAAVVLLVLVKRPSSSTAWVASSSRRISRV